MGRCCAEGAGVCRRCGTGLSGPGADEARAGGTGPAPPRSYQVKGGARYLKKSRGLLRERGAVKFAFIATHRGIWPTEWLCEALGVSRAGFYAWRTRSPSARARANDQLLTRVRASFLAIDRTYGARRVWHDLLADGVSCGRHRIERLM